MVIWSWRLKKKSEWVARVILTLEDIWNQKNENFSSNLNIRVPLDSINLFLDVFLCLKLILIIEDYMKLLTIFIWKFEIFWSWQLALWNLRQLAPESFFYLQLGMFDSDSILKKIDSLSSRIGILNRFCAIRFSLKPIL